MMRKFARIPDSPDPRDRRYASSQLGAVQTAPPQSVDLRSLLPGVFDQGDEGSCGPCSASAHLCQLQRVAAPYSRQQIYYSTRVLEKSVNADAGVQTRDLFKVLTKTGAAPESAWPYLPRNLFNPPPASVLAVAAHSKISSYMRLVGEDDMVACLSEGFTFVLGFECYDSIEGDQISRTGVMVQPDVKHESYVGGHDVLVVGYDLKFRSSPTFKKSGVDATLVSDHALLIRNSWGTAWGIQGHFWMPISYAVNPSTGGDSWTGRL